MKSLLCVTALLLAQTTSGFEGNFFLNSLKENEPLSITGCTLEKDAYHTQETSFALLQAEDRAALFIRTKEKLLETLAAEDSTNGERLWETHGGLWSSNYARDIWDSLKTNTFKPLHGRLTPLDMATAFQSKSCKFTYKRLDAYTKK